MGAGFVRHINRACEFALAQELAEVDIGDLDHKHVLAIREGATENAPVAKELLEDLGIAKQTLASRQEALKLTETLLNGGSTGLLDVRQAEQLVETAAVTTLQLKDKYRELFGEQSRSNHKQFCSAASPGEFSGERVGWPVGRHSETYDISLLLYANWEADALRISNNSDVT